MSVTPRTVPAEAPTGAGARAVPARKVGLGRAVRLGLVGGVVAAFVSAIGLVQALSEREIVGDLALSSALLLSIPIVFGYLSGRPPPALEGFEAPGAGLRNVVAGGIAGLLTGGILALFVALVTSFNVRRVLLNVSPTLIEILTEGRGAGPTALRMVVAGAVLGAGAGAIHLLPDRWRRGLIAAAVWIVALGMMQSLFLQVLNGIEDVVRIETTPLVRFLYAGGSLQPAAAVTFGVAALAGSVLRAGRRGVVRGRVAAMPPRSRRIAGVVAVIALIGVLGLIPQILGPFLSEVLNIAGIFLLMALGLNIVVGFAGLLDLGYVAFFAVGAYATAVLTSPSSPRFAPELVFWEAIPFVILAAAVAGIMVGTPVLRMRGDYLAIVTLGFGEIARLLFLSDWLKPTFGGAQGLISVPNIPIGPVTVRGPQLFFYALFAFVLLAAYVSFAMQDSRVGRAWMAMREDESVAEAMGVNIVSAKLAAFIIGAILAGFGGALFATKIGSVFPHSFDVIVSITVLVVIIVGGLASIPGVIVGSFVLVGLPELLREFEEFRFLIYGALLIFMMLRRPEGFIPSKRRAQELHEEEVLQDAWLRADREESRQESAPVEAG